MRTSASSPSGDFQALAVAGTRAILVALDCKPQRRTGLLGFSFYVQRQGAPSGWWLKSEKVFQSMVADPKNYNGPRDCDRFPVQSFLWSDFSVDAGMTQKFRIVPRYGAPSALTPDLTQASNDEINFQIQTEPEFDGKHGVWFNRGAIASQHFAEKYGNHAPQNINDPKDGEVQWLSRGLLEACLAYINGTPAGHALRVAAYEFTYKPILDALAAAAKTGGVDVQIVYHDTTKESKQAKGANETAMKASGLPVNDQKMTFKRSKTKIPHNKFIVHLDQNKKPLEVWTGSTNFTDSGFLGQTNVGHRIVDADLAQHYLDFWNDLKTDPALAPLRAKTAALTPDPPEVIGAGAMVPFFSPRAKSGMLNWYGRRMLDSANSVLFTAAFGISPNLLDPLAHPRQLMRFLLLEKPATTKQQQVFKKDRAYLQVSYGTPLGELYVMKNGQATARKPIKEFELDKWFFVEEHFRPQGSGFVFFVHTKSLVIDPLSNDPLVLTGSANFSSGSLLSNDENMLLIRGNTRVADIYMTEFDRIFRHFYFRDVANELHNKGNDAKSIYLDETSAWNDPYFTPGHTKNSRREMFFAKPVTTWVASAMLDAAKAGGRRASKATKTKAATKHLRKPAKTAARAKKSTAGRKRATAKRR